MPDDQSLQLNSKSDSFTENKHTSSDEDNSNLAVLESSNIVLSAQNPNNGIFYADEDHYLSSLPQTETEENLMLGSLSDEENHNNSEEQDYNYGSDVNHSESPVRSENGRAQTENTYSNLFDDFDLFNMLANNQNNLPPGMHDLLLTVEQDVVGDEQHSLSMLSVPPQPLPNHFPSIWALPPQTQTQPQQNPVATQTVQAINLTGNKRKRTPTQDGDENGQHVENDQQDESISKFKKL